jgi:hypothetical protein
MEEGSPEDLELGVSGDVVDPDDRGCDISGQASFEKACKEFR